MEMVLGALVVFGLRILDVSVGTVKLLYIVRGQRKIAAMLAFVESSIWLVAAAKVFSQLDNLWNMAGFSAGFATGTVVGMTIERWIGSGHALLRIITRDHGQELLDELYRQGFGLTTVNGRGVEGNVMVLLVVARRKRTEEAIALVQRIDPDAFITVDPVSPAAGGYLFPSALPSALRK